MDAWLCSRWNESYPSILNQAPEFGTGQRDFSFLACSGYTGTQIKEEQVPKLQDKLQQLITLSAGGNDVFLAEILDACVYQWSPSAATSDKCPDVLEKASDAIDNNLFDWLNDLYTPLKEKLTDDGKIYVTGYAQFWANNTDQCSNISWYVYPRR
jgi:lysophospholipase L1-like esterase